jgi:hypothetical protein
MVWGMTFPSANLYRATGDFPGFRDRLIAYAKEKMTDTEKAQIGNPLDYPYHVSAKYTMDRGPLAPHEIPSEVVTTEIHKLLGSLVTVGNSLLAVDEALKDIIERLEPGVHQFWPIKITNRKGQDYPKQFFGMIILRYLDSFRPAESDEGSWFDRGGGRSYSILGGSKGYAGAAMSKAIIGGAHLWREKKLADLEIFFSDELQAAIQKAGLRIPKHFKLKAV